MDYFSLSKKRCDEMILRRGIEVRTGSYSLQVERKDDRHVKITVWNNGVPREFGPDDTFSVNALLMQLAIKAASNA